MRRARTVLRACLALAVLVGTTSATVGTGSAGPIEDKRAQAARISAQLDAGANQVAQLSKQADRAKGQLGATETALAGATAEANAADTHLHQTQTRLANQAVDAYVHGGSAGLLSELTKSNGSDLECASSTRRSPQARTSRPSTTCAPHARTWRRDAPACAASRT